MFAQNDQNDMYFLVQVLLSLDPSERSVLICGPGLLVRQMRSSNGSSLLKFNQQHFLVFKK